MAKHPQRRSSDASSTSRSTLIGIAILIVLAIAGLVLYSQRGADTRDDHHAPVRPRRARDAGVATSRRDAGHTEAPIEREVESLMVRIVATHPHASDAFTQGLLWHDGKLFESTGLYGHSSVRSVELETGVVIERHNLAGDVFAEGLARVGNELFQITWNEEIAYVWTVDGFRRVRAIDYDGEGWGLCFDGTHLVMSDGSSRLAFRDPTTFRIERSVVVREHGRPIDQLNELECVDGVVWANIWQTDRIVRIDPADGSITGVVDASGLLTDLEQRDADVLNGIAWIPERQHFAITGKQWPRLFEVEFVARD